MAGGPKRMAKSGKRSLKRQEVYGSDEPDRRRVTSIPAVVVVRSLNVTKDDLSNRFFVTLTVAELEDIPEGALGYCVAGWQTAEQFSGVVALKLWDERCILNPECQLELFFNDGSRLLPSCTLAEALKISQTQRNGGDGVNLELSCVVNGGDWFDEFFDDV